MPINCAVLLSGSGTTLENLMGCIARGELDVTIQCAVSSRRDAYGLERARNNGIPAEAVHKGDYARWEDFDAALWDRVGAYSVDLIVLAGFMSLLSVPERFVNRIMNVHPGLIPAFSGKGMYGRRVHEAVLAYGAKVTGATVHFVDEEYDHGPIILQECVPVLDDDTAETLEARVQAKERELYPRAIQLFAEGRLRVEGRRVHAL